MTIKREKKVDESLILREAKDRLPRFMMNSWFNMCYAIP
jgi:hypothetical protein